MNDRHVLLRRGNSILAFLLEAVQYEDRFFELDGVDGPVSSTGIVFDHLQHPAASETLHHLGGIVLLAVLGKIQGVSEELPHTCRKPHQVPFAAPNPEKWSYGSMHILIILEQVWGAKPLSL